MSESDKTKKVKIEALLSSFSEAGFEHDAKISHEELIKYLNTRAKSGEFSKIISEKLFQVLSLDASSSLPVEDFISGFLQFEEDIKTQADALNVKLAKEKETYNKLIEDFKRKSELCEDAKVSGEITDIDIQRDIKGIKELIIKVVFNDKVEEFHFKLGDKEGEMDKKNFEFKPTSRNDHFEFIMQGVNNKGQTFDIGRKVFPLTNVMFSEEYLVKIEVPEMDDENKVAAYINAKIILFWNDINFETQKRKQELKIKKLKLACKDAADYLKKLKEIYTGIKIKKKEHKKQIRKEVNINIKSKQKKRRELDVYYNNIKKEPKKKNFVVEFNNEKKVKSKLNLPITKVVKEPEPEPEPEQEPEPKKEVIIPPKPIKVIKVKQEQAIQTKPELKEVAVNTIEKVVEEKVNIPDINIEINNIKTNINTNYEEYPVSNKENIMVGENLNNQEVYQQPIEDVNINRMTFSGEFITIPLAEEQKPSYEENIEPANDDINNLVQQEENIQVNNFENEAETKQIETFTQEQTYTEPTPVETFTQEQTYTQPIPQETIIPEPTYTEPKPIESIIQEPTYTELKPVETIIPESTYTEPKQVESIIPEPTYTEPTPVESIIPEQTYTEPKPVETIIPEPTYTEPKQIESIIPQVTYNEPTPIETFTQEQKYTESAPLETFTQEQTYTQTSQIQDLTQASQIQDYSSSSSQIKTYTHVNPVKTFTKIRPVKTFTTVNPMKTLNSNNQLETYIPENQVQTFTQETQLESYTSSNQVETYTSPTPVETYVPPTPVETYVPPTPVETYVPPTPLKTYTPATNVSSYSTYSQVNQTSIQTLPPVQTYSQTLPTITPATPIYSTYTKSVPNIPPVQTYSTYTKSVPTITPIRTYTTHTQSVPTVPQARIYSTQTYTVPTVPQTSTYSTQTQSVPTSQIYSKVTPVQLSTIISPMQLKQMEGYNNRFYRVNLAKKNNPRSRSHQAFRNRYGFGFPHVRYH